MFEVIFEYAVGDFGDALEHVFENALLGNVRTALYTGVSVFDELLRLTGLSYVCVCVCVCVCRCVRCVGLCLCVCEGVGVGVCLCVFVWVLQGMAP